MNKLILIALFFISVSIAIWCFRDGYLLSSAVSGVKEIDEQGSYIVEHLSNKEELFCEVKAGTTVKLFESSHKVLQKQSRVIKSSSDQFFKIGISILLVSMFQLAFAVIVLKKDGKNKPNKRMQSDHQKATPFDGA